MKTPAPNPARTAMRRFLESPTSVRWAIVVLIVGIIAEAVLTRDVEPPAG